MLASQNKGSTISHSAVPAIIIVMPTNGGYCSARAPTQQNSSLHGNTQEDNSRTDKCTHPECSGCCWPWYRSSQLLNISPILAHSLAKPAKLTAHMVLMTCIYQRHMSLPGSLPLLLAGSQWACVVTDRTHICEQQKKVARQMSLSGTSSPDTRRGVHPIDGCRCWSLVVFQTG